MEDTRLLDAMHYSNLGISQIPLIPFDKRPPRGFRWAKYRKQPPDQNLIRDWFDRTDFNIGIVCGPASGGLTVRDFDVPAAYERWTAENPALSASLPTVRTKRCVHVYFRSRYDGIAPLADGELRGDGAIVVAPGSIHHTGFRYRWILPIVSVEQVPEVDPAIFLPAAHDDRAKEYSNNGHVCHSSVEAAIRLTLPETYGEREQKLWQLARRLKRFGQIDAKIRLEIIRDWHRRALPKIRTKPFRDTQVAFERAWQRATVPLGSPQLKQALAVASDARLPLCCEQYAGTHFERLVRLILALHQIHGGGQFYLGCRTAATCIDLSFAQCARMLRILNDDGIIEVANYDVQIGVRAREYRYVGHRLEVAVPNSGTDFVQLLAKKMKAKVTAMLAGA